MNAEIAIKSVQTTCPRKRTKSTSEADEVLELKRFPLAVTLSNRRLKAIGIYASQLIGQAMRAKGNCHEKTMIRPED